MPTLLTLLLSSALAAGPQSTLVDAAFIDGAEVVSGAPELADFAAALREVAAAENGNCAKSEYLIWDSQTGMDAQFQRGLKTLGYTYTPLVTDREGGYFESFKASKPGSTLVGLWADSDGTTLLGWCLLKVAQTAAPAATPTSTSRPTTMNSALDHIQRLWDSTQPPTGMFSANWHVENIIYTLRSGSPAGVRIQTNAARTALSQSGTRAVDLAFLNLLDAVAAAQLGQRPELTKLLEGISQGAYAVPLRPVSQFLQAYQLPKAAPPAVPTPAAGPGGTLVPGDYSCWLERPGPNGTRSDVPRGTLTLRTNGTYTYMGKSGTFRYNAASGVVTFTAGYFTNPTPERTSWIRHQKTAQIDIHWAYANDWSCGMNL
ncbi:hypothetical protein [Deinococcus aerolatus]|nr:hypothetical protein [Deinococcus aerolatus]